MLLHLRILVHGVHRIANDVIDCQLLYEKAFFQLLAETFSGKLRDTDR